MTWLLEPEPETPQLPAPFVEQILMQQDVAASAEPTQLILQLLQLVDREKQLIEELSRGQADNPLWSFYQNGRLTASNISIAIKCKKTNRKPAPSSVKQLLKQYYAGGAKAVQWGQNHEAEARHCYETVCGVSVLQCGIFLHCSGVFGGSPDGIVSRDKIIEIKCPYAAEDCKVTEMFGNQFYITIVSPGL
jgi:hypothetical protein